ncbi:MAG: hypothetical protein JWQ27_2369 [Ferruginibacter sp.]|nr:hypothetical protein [Ferruginibacter sp.]
MNKILVPTDFSPNASKALEYAVEIAKLADAEILLLHVSDEVDAVFRRKHPLEEKHGVALDEAIEIELALIQQKISQERVSIQAKAYGGQVVPSVIDVADEYEADLIIMGSLGDTGFKEKLLGSVSAAVIGRSLVPVLVIPLLATWVHPEKMVLAINHFDDEPSLAAPAFELAKLFKAKVTVAVFTGVDKAIAVDYLENTRGLLLYEQKLKTIYHHADIAPGMLDGHHFEETLNDYLETNDIDMLVMFTHHKHLPESIFHRSLTKKISYHTNIPLLAIPVQKK